MRIARTDQPCAARQAHSLFGFPHGPVFYVNEFVHIPRSGFFITALVLYYCQNIFYQYFVTRVHRYYLLYDIVKEVVVYTGQLLNRFRVDGRSDSFVYNNIILYHIL